MLRALLRAGTYYRGVEFLRICKYFVKIDSHFRGNDAPAMQTPGTLQGPAANPHLLLVLTAAPIASSARSSSASFASSSSRNASSLIGLVSSV